MADMRVYAERRMNIWEQGMTISADWRTTVLAAAALLVAIGIIWRYAVAPIGAALWAAILAAPQIADDLHDLPDLIVQLRRLVDSNVIGQIATLRTDMAEVKRDLAEMRAEAVIRGGAIGPDDEIPMTTHDFEAIRRRIHDAGHIPEEGA